MHAAETQLSAALPLFVGAGVEGSAGWTTAPDDASGFGATASARARIPSGIG
jgi:hypothetical protein